MEHKIRKIALSTVVLLCVVLTAFVSGCSLFGNCGGEPDDGIYTIQYFDGTETRIIEVQSGQHYFIDILPEKEGYDFMGLYDAETGGTQYISADGNSVAPFTDGKDITLFPQFRAKEYTVILDYGGAAVTGSRQFTVSYGSSLPELPNDLTLEHSEFSGWYTSPDNGGVQVADEYGLIPVVSVVNVDNFDLSSGFIYLYAGFEAEKLTVVFDYCDRSITSDTMQIAYGTDIADVVPDGRNANGYAVLTWTAVADSDIPFTGQITESITLYAIEWAPVIELDVNGGKTVPHIVAVSGTSVSLPTPERENYRFIGWFDESGKEAEISVMPETSISYTAKWQAMLVFDENGGTEVDDISVAADMPVSLPVPERSGYIFAGWYDDKEERYTDTIMPETSIELKAGWYKAKKKDIVLRSDDDETFSYSFSMNIFVTETNTSKGPNKGDWIIADLSEYIPSDGADVSLTLHYKIYAGPADVTFSGGYYFYDASVISDANYVGKVTHDVVTDETWHSYERSCDLTLRSNTLYICYYALSGPEEPDGYSNSMITFGSIWMEMSYPDTSELFL